MWHPIADAGEAVSSDTATRGGGGARHGHYSPRPKETSHNTSTLESLEAVLEEPISEQHEPEGAGESRKVLLSWREWSMRREELLDRRGQLRKS